MTLKPSARTAPGSHAVFGAAGALAALVALVLLCPLAARADVASQIIGPGKLPRLKIDTAGRLHLLYQDQQMVRYRWYAGAAWSQAEDVPGSSGVSGSKFTRHRFVIQPDGARIYVTWGYGYGTNIDFALKDAAGWHGPETACPAAVRAWEYAGVAATSSTDAYVFCQFDDAWVAHRFPNGTWESPTYLYNIPPGAKHIVADADANDEIHVFCRKGAVTYFHGDGTSFSPLIFLETAGSTELPAFVFDTNNRIHLVWQDWVRLAPDNWEPQTVRYATGQHDQWSNANAGVVVHAYVEPANPPEVAVDVAGNVVVTWIEGTAVLFSTSSDGGATFTPAQTAATDPRPVGGLPTLAGDLRTPPSVFVGNQLHMVYENDSNQLVHLYGLEPFVTEPDAGVEPDAQVQPDAQARPDGAQQLPDASVAPDGSPAPEPDAAQGLNTRGGCHCTWAPTPTGKKRSDGSGALLLLLGALAAIAWAGRTRRPRRNSRTRPDRTV